MEAGRNIKGQFANGHVTSPLAILNSIRAAKEIRDKNPLALGDRKYTYLYNCWRAFRFTNKGKNIGCQESWKIFNNFYNDMFDSYEVGLKLYRTDTSKPFSKTNCLWMTESEAQRIQGKSILLEYNGESKTMTEWSHEYGIPLNAMRQRYQKWKNTGTTKEILFGKDRTIKRIITDSKVLAFNKQRTKASKMIASYRCTDKKKGFECDLDIEFVINEIFSKSCSYCDSSEKVGCDRIENTKGHTKNNVIPACYECNYLRSDLFTVEEMKEIGNTIKIIKQKRVNRLLKA